MRTPCLLFLHFVPIGLRFRRSHSSYMHSDQFSARRWRSTGAIVWQPKALQSGERAVAFEENLERPTTGKDDHA
jgi:hypothetical protein